MIDVQYSVVASFIQLIFHRRIQTLSITCSLQDHLTPD